MGYCLVFIHKRLVAKFLFLHHLFLNKVCTIQLRYVVYPYSKMVLPCQKTIFAIK